MIIILDRIKMLDSRGVYVVKLKKPLEMVLQKEASSKLKDLLSDKLSWG